MTRLTRDHDPPQMYERNKTSGTVWVTLKRSESPPLLTCLPTPYPSLLRLHGKHTAVCCLTLGNNLRSHAELLIT